MTHDHSWTVYSSEQGIDVAQCDTCHQWRLQLDGVTTPTLAEPTEAEPHPVTQPGGHTLWLDGNGNVVSGPEDD